MRRMLISALLVAIIFSACPTKGVAAVSEPGDGVCYGSERMFAWLATTPEGEYVIGAWSCIPSFEGSTPSAIYFRGNGVCELVDLGPAEGVEVAITRGTWQIDDEKLLLMLTSLQTYGEGNIDELALPELETFEIADWKDTEFRVHVPKERMFEGIATELKREYLAGRSWISVPYAAGDSAPIELALEEDGAYELYYAGGTNLQGQTKECSITERGTWAIVDNKLVLTKTGHGDVGSMEELDPAIVDAYEITDLQYVFEIPKEHVTPFVQCDGLLYLGEQLTMRIGETQFWY